MQFWHAGVITVEIGPRFGVQPSLAQENHLVFHVKIKWLHLEGESAAKSAYSGKISRAWKCAALIIKDGGEKTEWAAIGRISSKKKKEKKNGIFVQRIL